MARTAAIGIQDFGDLIQKNYLYIDITSFIKEWWDSGDSVTLLTRPHRFGKTLRLRKRMSFLDAIPLLLMQLYFPVSVYNPARRFSKKISSREWIWRKAVIGGKDYLSIALVAYIK